MAGAIYYNGQGFEIAQVTTATNAVPAAVSYGGRTCIGIDPAATGGSYTVEVGLVNKIMGRCVASTDTPPLGWHLQLRFAIETMTITDGAEAIIFYPLLNGGSDLSGNCTHYLVIKRAGAVYTLYARVVQAGTTYEHAVTTVAVGTTFHTLDWWLFSDEHYTYWDGTLVSHDTMGVASTSVYLYRFNVVQNTTAVEWPVDSLWLGLEEWPGTATLDRSTTNGAPDNGNLYWITEDGIAAEVITGDAGEIAISDGDVDTSSFPASKNLLLCKVLTGNNGGYGEKGVTDGSSNYSKSEWTL